MTNNQGGRNKKERKHERDMRNERWVDHDEISIKQKDGDKTRRWG